MPKIRIERHPVQTLKLGVLGFDHLQLVYQQDEAGGAGIQDHWFLIEGLRERTADGIRLSVEGWEGLTTLSDANGGASGEALEAKIDTPAARGSRIVPVGGDEHRAWATMASFAGDIEAQGFPYIAVALPGSPIPTINSSSLVASLLYYIGVDIASVMPFGARLSPGTTTLIGSSGDDQLAIDRGFTTIVGGEGRDVLFGGAGAATDKLYGGKDDDRFVWSKGFNIVHGGQTGLAYENDGVDLLSYVSAGTVRIEANPDALPHYRPDFIVTTAEGLDHLYSVEQIAWDPASDRIVLGKGVGLIMLPNTLSSGPGLGSEPGSESGKDHRLLVGRLEMLRPEGGDEVASGPSEVGQDTPGDLIDLRACAYERYSALADDAVTPAGAGWGSEPHGIEGLAGFAADGIMIDGAAHDFSGADATCGLDF